MAFCYPTKIVMFPLVTNGKLVIDSPVLRDICSTAQGAETCSESGFSHALGTKCNNPLLVPGAYRARDMCPIGYRIIANRCSRNWMGTEESWRLKRALRDYEGLGVLEDVARLERSPRCLTCASSKVENIGAPLSRDLPHTDDIELPFFHPGCGGGLKFKDSGGYRLAKDPTVLRMTVEGEIIGRPPETRESYTVAAYYGPPRE